MNVMLFFWVTSEIFTLNWQCELLFGKLVVGYYPNFAHRAKLKY